MNNHPVDAEALPGYFQILYSSDVSFASLFEIQYTQARPLPSRLLVFRARHSDVIMIRSIDIRSAGMYRFRLTRRSRWIVGEWLPSTTTSVNRARLPPWHSLESERFDWDRGQCASREQRVGQGIPKRVARASDPVEEARLPRARNPSHVTENAIPLASAPLGESQRSSSNDRDSRNPPAMVAVALRATDSLLFSAISYLFTKPRAKNDSSRPRGHGGKARGVSFRLHALRHVQSSVSLCDRASRR